MKSEPPHGFALGAAKGKKLTTYFTDARGTCASFTSTLSGRTNIPSVRQDLAIEEAKVALLQLADKLQNFGPPTTYLGQYARENFSKVTSLSVDGHRPHTFSIQQIFKSLQKDLALIEQDDAKKPAPLVASMINHERLDKIREFFPQVR